MAERTVSVKLKADVAQYMAQMRAAGRATSDLEKAGLDLKVALNSEEEALGRVRVATARLEDLRKSGKASVAQLAQAEEQLATAHRSVEVAQDRVIVATKRYEEAQRSASDADKQRLGDLDRETEKVAKRANAQFEALQFTVFTVGLPAAAAIGSAAAVGSLALVSAGFVGLAAVALRSNTAVASSYQQLGDQIDDSVTGMAQPLADDFIEASNKIGDAFDRLAPQIQRGVSNATPAIGILTDGVIDLADEALPGLVHMSGQAGPALLGVADFAGKAGRGVTDFALNISTASHSAGENISTLGDITEDALAFLGQFAANLSNNGGPALDQFAAAASIAEQILLNLTSSGSGAIGMLTGFGATVNGVLGLLNAASSLLGMLPAGVTQFGGSLLATTKLMSLFGLSAGAAFDGLGQRIRDADGARAKFGAGFAGLAAGAFSPVTLAAAALTVGLSVLGNAQQDAAAKAAAHRDRVNDLAGALRESNGAINANVRATAASALADFDAGDGKRNLLGDVRNLVGPGGIPLLTDAYLGNKTAAGQLATQLQAVVDGHKKEANSLGLVKAPFDDHIRVLGGVAYEYDETGFKAQQLLDILNSSGGTFADAAAKNQDLAVAANEAGSSSERLSHSQKLARQGAADLATAFTGLADTATDAATKGSLLQQVLDRLNGRTPSYEESVQSINDAIRGLTDDFIKGAEHADGWGMSLLNADGTINTMTANGSELQDTVETLQQGFANATTSIDDLVKGGMSFDAASKQINDTLATQRDRFIEAATAILGNRDAAVQLADKYGLIPSQLTTEFRTPGIGQALQGFEELRGRIVGMPDEKTIIARGVTDEAMKRMQDLGLTVERLPNGTVKVTAATEAAQEALKSFLAEANAANATTKVFGDTAPAVGAVKDWQNLTNETVGNTTTYTYTDPATKAVTQWKFTTDATGATTTTRSITDPATGAVITWKRNTDGTWATVNVNAAAGQAYATLNDLTRTRYATIVYTTQNTSAIGGKEIRNVKMQADGGVLGFASGGITAYASGGLRRVKPMRPIASIVPPDTWRIIGDNMRVSEAYIPLDPRSERSRRILDYANRAMGYSYTGGASSLEVQAAQEMLAAIANNKTFYEDFSFKGMSDNADAWQEVLAKKFYAANPGVDFGTWESRTAVERFLRGMVTSSSVQDSVRNGRAVGQVPTRITTGGTQVYNFSFPNYVGNRQELVNAIRGEVRDKGGNVQKVFGR